jgi:hypothetical protein
VLDCGGAAETLTVRWLLDAVPPDAHPTLTPRRAGACQPCAPPAAPILELLTTTDDPEWRHACLCPEKGSAQPSVAYPVRLFVSDGRPGNEHVIEAQPFSVQVEADQPPCVDGVDPPPGSYVIDRTQPQRFQVVDVLDDRDVEASVDPAAQLQLTWAIWRTSDPAWRLVPLAGAHTLTFDASTLPVGERVRVRTQPIDRMGARATCADAVDVCTVSTCLPQLSPGACEEWVTWDLEVR